MTPEQKQSLNNWAENNPIDDSYKTISFSSFLSRPSYTNGPLGYLHLDKNSMKVHIGFILGLITIGILIQLIGPLLPGIN